jgi:hypothetical protein
VRDHEPLGAIAGFYILTLSQRPWCLANNEQDFSIEKSGKPIGEGSAIAGAEIAIMVAKKVTFFIVNLLIKTFIRLSSDFTQLNGGVRYPAATDLR